MKLLIIGILLSLSFDDSLGLSYNARETEMFAVPISPNMFNWTYQEFDQQYRFQASLIGKPELPSWLRYIYSARHHSGFVFGTPPRGTKSPVILEVVGLNRDDFETRRLQLTVNVGPRDVMAKYEVELKIDNLNVEDLLDEHRMTRLKDIFRNKLWLESSADLYTTFLASAIDLGARLPLKPNEGEGAVIRLGSSKPFSSEVRRVREEVRPLSRLPVCPRDYKRTTVERIFRDDGFTLDWCNMQLYNTIYTPKKTSHLEYLSEIPTDPHPSPPHRNEPKWSSPLRSALPTRSYTKEISAIVAAPLLVMVIGISALTMALCVHYAGVTNRSSKIEICRYETSNSEQTQVADNVSNRSVGVSPNNSLARPYSPKSTTNLAGSYNRPQPPPYLGSATNTLHNRKSTNSEKSPQTGNTDRHLALEDSIKLLNEANIGSFEHKLPMDSGKSFEPKEQIVDYADGMDDYVPIEKNGYVVMKGDLDDIVVPELTKYGLGGIASGI